VASADRKQKLKERWEEFEVLWLGGLGRSVNEK
jgi:hypothetical protein